MPGPFLPWRDRPFIACFTLTSRLRYGLKKEHCKLLGLQGIQPMLKTLAGLATPPPVAIVQCTQDATEDVAKIRTNNGMKTRPPALIQPEPG
jgi:hypothetical protein